MKSLLQSSTRPGSVPDGSVPRPALLSDKQGCHFSDFAGVATHTGASIFPSDLREVRALTFTNFSAIVRFYISAFPYESG